MRMHITVPVIYGYLRRQIFIFKDGITYDLSTAGMSFYTDRPFRKGMHLRVQSSYLWNCSRVGTVMWCSMKSYDIYRIGILFQ